MTLTLSDIASAVAPSFNVRVKDMRGPRRDRAFARARFAFCALARARTQITLTEIGYWLGKRDHTTIMSAEHRGHELLLSDPDFAAQFHASAERLGKGEQA